MTLSARSCAVATDDDDDDDDDAHTHRPGSLGLTPNTLLLILLVLLLLLLLLLLLPALLMLLMLSLSSGGAPAVRYPMRPITIQGRGGGGDGGRCRGGIIRSTLTGLQMVDGKTMYCVQEGGGGGYDRGCGYIVTSGYV